MTTPLVFIETRGGRPTPGSLGLAAVGQKVAGRCGAVVCGPGSRQVAGILPGHGFDQVWYCEDPRLDATVAQPQVDAVEHLVRQHGYDLLLFENSTLAADVAGGLSARLAAGVNWDLNDLSMRDETLVGSRLALADTLAVEVGWDCETKLAVFRVGAAEPVDHPVSGDASGFAIQIADHALAATVVGRAGSAAGDVAIESAKVIVAGGRGLRDRASLEMLEELAAALGGTVGVTLPIVDLGWYPASRQIGQTGTIVKPALYIACGISGALQHRVGMEKSNVVIAINSDPHAPIFGFCDAGLVGDLHEIVPELTRLVRARAATQTQSYPTASDPLAPQHPEKEKG